MSDLIAQMRQYIAKHPVMSPHRQNCLDLCVALETAQDLVGANEIKWMNIASGHLARIKQLEAQLPETMQDCTIQFLQCDKGHGRLTAKNWATPTGCHWCRIAELEAELQPGGS